MRIAKVLQLLNKYLIQYLPTTLSNLYCAMVLAFQPMSLSKEELPSRLETRPNTYIGRLFVSGNFTILLSIPFAKQVLGWIIEEPVLITHDLIHEVWPATVVLRKPKKPPDKLWFFPSTTTMLLLCLWSSLGLPYLDFICTIETQEQRYLKRLLWKSFRKKMHTLARVALRLCLWCAITLCVLCSFATQCVMHSISSVTDPLSVLQATFDHYTKPRSRSQEINFLDLFATIEDETKRAILFESLFQDKRGHCQCPLCAPRQKTPSADSHPSKVSKDLQDLNFTRTSLFADPTPKSESLSDDESCDSDLVCIPCDPLINPTAHLTSEAALKVISESHDIVEAIVDTGATRACLSNKDEFDSLTIKDYAYNLKGIAAGLSIKGEGTALFDVLNDAGDVVICLLYTSPSPRDKRQSRMPSSA